MEALITGGDGFLGRHFARELTARGYEVTTTDTKSGDAFDCRNLFRWELEHRSEARPWDLVVHAAAVIGGRATIDGSPLETAVNLELDAAMFRWAAVARPGRVVYFSSSAAYPVMYQRDDGDPMPLSERHIEFGPLIGMPDQVYGWTKVVGEVLAGKLWAEGVPVTVVRPFSGYGEDQDATYPFRAILERVRRREDPLTVWSDTVRDFIHVDDIVAGTLAVAEAGVTEPVNLCTGRPTSFGDLARLMASVAGYTPEVKVLSSKPTGVAYRVGDPSRLLEHYTPTVSLEQGIVRALESGATV